MKRKIIKQGHNTLTITLPSKWVKQFNIKGGDEIDLIEKDNALLITREKNIENQSKEIDISGIDIPSIWKYFMGVYREGYDEVKVKFDPNTKYESPYKFVTSHGVDRKYKKIRLHTSFELIQEISNRLIGFEIIEHHKDHCIIKDVSDISSKEFESSLRRIFLLIQQMGEELVESIKTNNTKILEHTHDIDINIDRFHDYCIRVLNKTGFKDVKKSHLFFSTIYILELIGDEFKNLSFHLTQDFAGKKLDNLKQLAEMILYQFNSYYDLFYKFRKEKIVEMSKRDMEIYFYLPKLYKKKPGKKSELTDDEREVFNHFRRIGKYINALLELRIEIEC